MRATRRPPPVEDSGPETEPMTIAALAERIDGLHVELRVELTAALQQGLISAASDPDTWAAMVNRLATSERLKVFGSKLVAATRSVPSSLGVITPASQTMERGRSPSPM